MLSSHARLLRNFDSELDTMIRLENERQEDHIELIASENYVSAAVMEAQGSQLTNKYAEGYPGKRYYGGCEFIDKVEQLAIDRVCALFRAEAANVQPHSGSQANQAVFFAMLRPGDTILSMNLAHGGHLTHGASVNLSGQWFRVISYGLNAEEDIDYEAVEQLSKEHKPKLIIAGASAFSRKIDFERFASIAKKCSAFFMVDMAHYAGLIATGLYPDPVIHADFVTSTTHKTLRGPRGGLILCKERFIKKINSAVFPGIQGGPLMHIIAAKAVAFKEAAMPEFIDYQKRVLANARRMAEVFTSSGLRVVSGNTESHMMLIDLTKMNITGKDAEVLLQSVNITVNKNSIPHDSRSPFITSGIRVGTPAITTRGFTEIEAAITANLIVECLSHATDSERLAKIRMAVHELTQRYPVYC